MAQIGSFALLIALALSVYSFVAGIVALVLRPGPDERNSHRSRTARHDDSVSASLLRMLRRSSDRIAETARRAGLMVFIAVLLAAIALVISAFRDDFSIAYIFHHSNRDLPAAYKFA